MPKKLSQSPWAYVDRHEWTYRAGIPVKAEMALSKGVRLEAMHLSENERDLLIVALPYWPWPDDEYHQAAWRLAERIRYQGPLLPRTDLAEMILAVAPRLREPMDVFPRPGRGRPKRISWRPWEWPWSIALELILPMLLRNHVEALGVQTREPRPEATVLLDSRGTSNRIPGWSGRRPAMSGVMRCGDAAGRRRTRISHPRSGTQLGARSGSTYSKTGEARRMRFWSG